MEQTPGTASVMGTRGGAAAPHGWTKLLENSNMKVKGLFAAALAVYLSQPTRFSQRRMDAHLPSKKRKTDSSVSADDVAVARTSQPRRS